MPTNRFVWGPWESRGDWQWRWAFLPLGKSVEKLGVFRGPKGYEAWLNGRHTHRHASLEEAIAAGRRLVQRMLRQRIEDMVALLADVEQIPCPPDVGTAQEGS